MLSSRRFGWVVLAAISLACGGSGSEPVTPPDSGTPSQPDAGAPNSGTPDAGTPDAGTPDSGTPDAGAPDAGDRFVLTLTRSGNGSGAVVSSPPGLDCGTLCSASFDAGTQVTLTASADAGSDFGGWSLGCSGANTTCSITVDQTSSVGASFVLQQETLTVSIAGSGSGTVTSSPAGISCPGTCAANFDYGTTVTLTAHPAAGSAMIGWSDDCSGPSCAPKLTGPATATATFTAADLQISGFAFSPAGLTIDAGTTLLVLNDDGAPHTVTSEASDNAFVPGSVSGVSFDTGTIAAHGTAQITIPSTAGSGTVIPFFCNVHKSSMGNGHITVH
jgi:plastocyanin